MKNVNVKTLAAGILLLAMLVGIFLPWYMGESLFGLLLMGADLGGAIGRLSNMLDFGVMSVWFTVIFVMMALATVAAILFGLRAVVTSLSGKVKGLTPAGTLMSVLALGVIAIALFLGGLGDVQIGAWLCLLAGLAETVWGIFN